MLGTCAEFRTDAASLSSFLQRHHYMGSCLIRGVCLWLFLSAPLWAQTFDFEDGLPGWQRTGDAFSGQPYCGPITSTIFAHVTLGGTYWKDMPFPLGQHGSCLITSIAKPFDTPVGSLTSPEFSLRAEARFFSFRIGGTKDFVHERLELEVQIPENLSTDRMDEIREWSNSFGSTAPDGPYRIVYAATGSNSESLRQEVIEIPQVLRGMPARLRILDTSYSGHINVDYVQFTSTAPSPLRVPVWGFADYHTHPMSYMAFGGMKGIPTLWGVPGKSVDDYDDPTAISRDIPHCVPGHNGGYLAEGFINSSQLLRYDTWPILHSLLFPHGRGGGPEFNDFPDHLMGAHEQMHVTMVKRAYDGGLRLLVALATDNKAAQFLVGRVEHDHLLLIGEKESMEAQLSGMKHLASLNHTWMEVAYSSGEARRIIQENKLAVILGVEFDQLGELGFGADGLEPQLEADYLWNLGVRVATPIHAINNKVGSPAVFIGPYNWLNDLLHRDNTDATVKEVKKTKPAYFEVTGDNSCDPDYSVGECVLNQLDSRQQLRAAIDRSVFNAGRLGPSIFLTGRQKQFETHHGNKNVGGLTRFGRKFIGAMMDRGLIIDTAHMSDHSVSDTYSVIGERLAIQHPGCNDFHYGPTARPECDVDAYPAIISHAHFRGQAIYDLQIKVSEYLPSEYDISDTNLAMIQRVGGVVGPFVAEPRVDSSNIDGIKDDCWNSSKNFAFSFRYALKRVNDPADDELSASRVGMATDMTFIPMVSPRFGPHRCDGYKIPKNGDQLLRSSYQRFYQGQQPETRVAYAASSSSQVRPYRMGQRVFDFNEDGLANYGLLPDLLEDLQKLSDPDIQIMFRSAEGYLQMWEKVERLRGHLPPRISGN